MVPGEDQIWGAGTIQLADKIGLKWLEVPETMSGLGTGTTS